MLINSEDDVRSSLRVRVRSSLRVRVCSCLRVRACAYIRPACHFQASSSNWSTRRATRPTQDALFLTVWCVTPIRRAFSANVATGVWCAPFRNTFALSLSIISAEGRYGLRSFSLYSSCGVGRPFVVHFQLMLLRLCDVRLSVTRLP